jgi:hypothetical protein
MQFKHKMDKSRQYELEYFVPKENGERGAINCRYLGPAFGMGDLTLFEKKDRWGKSKLGRYYVPESGNAMYGSRFALFGTPHFEVEELEVYSVELRTVNY